MNTKTSNGKRGIDVLRDPEFNKSTAFTDAEKQALGIVGLVPDVTETEDLQLSRVLMQLGHKSTDLDRYISLIYSITTRRFSIGRSCPIRRGSFRSSTTQRLAKPVSSSGTSIAKRNNKRRIPR